MQTKTLLLGLADIGEGWLHRRPLGVHIDFQANATSRIFAFSLAKEENLAKSKRHICPL